ncbi:hypothetical protein GF373_17595 [bacterium]|nr:hypothetical protein [bacterium]
MDLTTEQKERDKQNLEQFTPEQLRFIRWQAVPKNMRKPPTLQEFADLLGVSHSTLLEWRRDSDMRMAVYEECRALEGDRLPEVLRTLSNRAVEGSEQSMKLYLQVHGYWRESEELDVNMKHQQLVVVLDGNNSDE